jgi:hypothetical protein
MKPKGEGNDRLEITDSLIGYLNTFCTVFLGRNMSYGDSTLWQKLPNIEPTPRQRMNLVNSCSCHLQVPIERLFHNSSHSLQPSNS